MGILTQDDASVKEAEFYIRTYIRAAQLSARAYGSFAGDLMRWKRDALASIAKDGAKSAFWQTATFGEDVAEIPDEAIRAAAQAMLEPVELALEEKRRDQADRRAWQAKAKRDAQAVIRAGRAECGPAGRSWQGGAA